jgi:hypothetical protein
MLVSNKFVQLIILLGLISIFIIGFIVFNCGVIDSFEVNNSVESEIKLQLASKFGITLERIKLFYIMYDPENKQLNFEIEIMNMTPDKGELSSEIIYKKLNSLINSGNLTIKINDNDVKINRIRSLENLEREGYSDPSKYIPKDFPEDIKYIQQAIDGIPENLGVTKFWSFNKKHDKIIMEEDPNPSIMPSLSPTLKATS